MEDREVALQSTADAEHVIGNEIAATVTGTVPHESAAVAVPSNAGVDDQLQEQRDPIREAGETAAAASSDVVSDTDATEGGNKRSRSSSESSSRSSRSRSRRSSRSDSGRRRRRESSRGRRVQEPSSSEATRTTTITRPDACCVRIGVFHPAVPVTREQVIDEMDAIRMTSRVEEVVMEPRDAYLADAPYYARIYFTSPELADLCAVELNLPRRASKWKHCVSQRLPRLGPMWGEIGTIPTFEPFRAEPPDSIAVETPEGYVVFSTDELYRTKGAIDYLEGKQQGHIKHRLICKHFDPQRHLPCRYGLSCNYIHVKAAAMWKLLLPTTSKQPLRHRYASSDGDANGLHLSLWEYARRLDTLILRYLAQEHNVNTLAFMFSGCEGYISASIQCTRDGKRFGFVQFTDRTLALRALLQTSGSNLNISVYGVMEDVRRVQSLTSSANSDATRTASEKPILRSAIRRPETHFRGTSSVAQDEHSPTSRSTLGNNDASSTPAKDVSFPPLPEGWEHGVSRRTNQYYFFQPKTKNSTTWKHPVTKERYSTS